jgi:hypothetical protein
MGLRKKGKSRIIDIFNKDAKGFSEKGYQFATLEGVAGQARSSKGGIYITSRSKRSFFLKVESLYV